MKIAPSILSVPKKDYPLVISCLEELKVDMLHLDVMDGKFVEKDTYQQMLEYSSFIKRISNLPMDVHLMVEDVKTAIDDFLAVEPNIITFHLEACKNKEEVIEMLKNVTKDCITLLKSRNVEIEKTKYKYYFDTTSIYWKGIVDHFCNDLNFFFENISLRPFNDIYRIYDTIIFENGQGLGLDQNVNNIWTTTSNTGILNPFNMLKDKEGFEAEVCYVTRPYVTRHGDGPLKNECRLNIVDRTNIFNDFQGGLRFGHLSKNTFERIDKDFSIVAEDYRFNKTIALTHANEHYDSDLLNQATYTSYDKYTVN